MKTAVECLVEEMFNQGYLNDKPFTIKNIEYFVKQAKEMEKEQIRIAYMEGAFEKMRHLDGKEFMMPTEYYNQTFKSE
jgi:hypothetical protein